jgi:hypothetical protein
LKLNNILKDIGCSDFNDYVKLSKKGFEIIINSPKEGEKNSYRFPDEIVEDPDRKLSGLTV